MQKSYNKFTLALLLILNSFICIAANANTIEPNKLQALLNKIQQQENLIGVQVSITNLEDGKEYDLQAGLSRGLNGVRVSRPARSLLQAPPQNRTCGTTASGSR